VAQSHSTAKITPKVQSGVEIVSWRKGCVPLGGRGAAAKLNCQGYISLLMMSKEPLWAFQALAKWKKLESCPVEFFCQVEFKSLTLCKSALVLKNYHKIWK
jgi:hypothetical protein